jgi:heterodisulfide reductase subunit B
MKPYRYYPGCSLSSTAKAYAQSLAAILAPLDVELHEVDDWNCCGATEYVTLSPLRGYALIGRNLALAERQAGGPDTLVAPCSACYVNLAKTDRYVRESPVLRDQLNEALAADGLHYTPGAMTVRHLLDVLIDDVGLDEVARHVVRPLHGLRVASYLGCLVSRPDHDGRWSSREQPLELDRLMAALGAEVVDYPLRTACCGGHMTQISPNTGFELIRLLIDGADRLHADLLVTVCPMCQMNVDAYQGEMNRHFRTHYQVPILFFTQLIGLAFGMEPAALGIGTELVSAHRALGRIGIELPPPAEEQVPEGGAARNGPETRRTRRSKELPMPRMNETHVRR